MLTVTFSPGAAQPQTANGVCGKRTHEKSNPQGAERHPRLLAQHLTEIAAAINQQHPSPERCGKKTHGPSHLYGGQAYRCCAEYAGKGEREGDVTSSDAKMPGQIRVRERARGPSSQVLPLNQPRGFPQEIVRVGVGNYPADNYSVGKKAASQLRQAGSEPDAKPTDEEAVAELRRCGQRQENANNPNRDAPGPVQQTEGCWHAEAVRVEKTAPCS